MMVGKIRLCQAILLSLGSDGNYYNSGDWYYNVYPFVPIEN